MRKVAELASQLFISNGQKPNVEGIILAGSADFKTQLGKSDLFDQRLARIVIGMVDVSYGGKSGFTQAIALSSDILGSVKLIKEKKLLQRYMEEISKDTGKYCFLVDDTLRALELGAVQDLIIWENLDIDRIVLNNCTSSEEIVVHLSKEQQSNENFFRDPETDAKLEVVEKESIVEWFANHYKDFGCNLELVTDHSSEGQQFVKAFGGIGGILRWKVNFVELSNYENVSNPDYDTSDDDDNGSIGDYSFGDDDFEF